MMPEAKPPSGPETPEQLIEEQRRIVGPDDAGFEREFCVFACPGSGKTRVVAQRFVRLATGRTGRAGVAVLSFSNVAAAEVTRRCQVRGAPGIAGSPNFVGTFDAFICRYFVSPFGGPWFDGRPHIVDSWSRLGVEVRPRAARAPEGLTLDELVIAPDGRTSLDIDRRVGRGIRAQVAGNKDAWERAAQQRRDGLLRAGYMSCADARHCALVRMRHPSEGPGLARALKARFEEIIVDEAQDCNDDDLQVIRWLRDAGIRLVVVGDPDQAIYEFRDARPASFRELAHEMEVRPLTGNFRSTRRICAVAATARTGATPDRALGSRADEDAPVVLLPYEGRAVPKEVGECFSAQCSRLGIPLANAVVLAHGATHARHAAGLASQEESTTGGRAGSLVHAAAELKAERDPRRRLAALDAAERVLLHRLALDSEEQHPEVVAEKKGIDLRWLRRAALGLLSRLPEPPACKEAVSAWVEAAQALLGATQAPPGHSWVRPPGSVLPRPSRWEGCKPVTASGLPALTVHRAKGMEFEAVLFVIPPNSAHSPSADLLREWQARTDSEQKRVAYVGLTRAKRLLVIAVPVTLAGHLADILARGGADFEQAPVVRAAVAAGGPKAGRPRLADRPL
ncbi:MAG: ATP-dependent helicase [Deltaproteobacteria bacterium]|nr:ATP-dependent helicase [Deltaproteobacteria bacterium]